MARIIITLLAAAFGAAFATAPAWGHGEQTTSNPARGALLRHAPEEVRVGLGEAPAEDARMVIIDGCGRDVTGSVTTTGTDVVARAAGGGAGRWTVTWAAISSLDGHDTRGEFSFRVVGVPDCPDAEGGNSPAAAQRPPADPPTLPVVPVSLGIVAFVGLAGAVRAVGGR